MENTLLQSSFLPSIPHLRAAEKTAVKIPRLRKSSGLDRRGECGIISIEKSAATSG